MSVGGAWGGLLYVDGALTSLQEPGLALTPPHCRVILCKGL